MINPISYVKLIWKNRGTALTTPVNATNLNHIENGIDAVTTQSNAIAEALNPMIQDVTSIKVVDSEEDLPEVGVAGRLYLVKAESEEEET